MKSSKRQDFQAEVFEFRKLGRIFFLNQEQKFEIKQLNFLKNQNHRARHFLNISMKMQYRNATNKE